MSLNSFVLLVLIFYGYYTALAVRLGSSDEEASEEDKLYIRMLPSKHIRVGRVVMESMLSSIREAVDKAVDDFWEYHKLLPEPRMVNFPANSLISKPNLLGNDQLAPERAGLPKLTSPVNQYASFLLEKRFSEDPDSQSTANQTYDDFPNPLLSIKSTDLITDGPDI
ncbi:putative transmembrane protein [Gregarina niphandrodes]|uniref:Transmembrane protein n=1 Tax=Gregarina niphandrodes TaxID=110365 RepID=A0A023B9Y0_GRENI|nr:putative transmembrane protein [Gregarina niphandrodes]EZG77005.1 putative transmembrane protein [Gregarina niphandrodes]|eukprot:XP_011129542.1 putative transmembrane protein [Gregarina niphandrodes]